MDQELKVLHKNPEKRYVEEGFSGIYSYFSPFSSKKYLQMFKKFEDLGQFKIQIIARYLKSLELSSTDRWSRVGRVMYLKKSVLDCIVKKNQK